MALQLAICTSVKRLPCCQRSFQSIHSDVKVWYKPADLQQPPKGRWWCSGNITSSSLACTQNDFWAPHSNFQQPPSNPCNYTLQQHQSPSTLLTMTAKQNVPNERLPPSSARHIWSWKRLGRRCRRQKRHGKSIRRSGQQKQPLGEGLQNRWLRVWWSGFRWDKSK